MPKNRYNHESPTIHHAYLDDNWIEERARIACEADYRQDNFSPEFDEKMSIRHHRMTIALAMPERKR